MRRDEARRRETGGEELRKREEKERKKTEKHPAFERGGVHERATVVKRRWFYGGPYKPLHGGKSYIIRSTKALILHIQDILHTPTAQNSNVTARADSKTAIML